MCEYKTTDMQKKKKKKKKKKLCVLSGHACQKS